MTRLCRMAELDYAQRHRHILTEPHQLKPRRPTSSLLSPRPVRPAARLATSVDIASTNFNAYTNSNAHISAAVNAHTNPDTTANTHSHDYTNTSVRTNASGNTNIATDTADTTNAISTMDTPWKGSSVSTLSTVPAPPGAQVISTPSPPELPPAIPVTTTTTTYTTIPATITPPSTIATTTTAAAATVVARGSGVKTGGHALSNGEAYPPTEVQARCVGRAASNDVCLGARRGCDRGSLLAEGGRVCPGSDPESFLGAREAVAGGAGLGIRAVAGEGEEAVEVAAAATSSGSQQEGTTKGWRRALRKLSLRRRWASFCFVECACVM